MFDIEIAFEEATFKKNKLWKEKLAGKIFLEFFKIEYFIFQLHVFLELILTIALT